MEITVRLFLSFRLERFHSKLTQYQGGATVATVVADLGIPEEKVGLILVNDRQAALSDGLVDGDVLALFPIVGGGSGETSSEHRSPSDTELLTFLTRRAENGLVAWVHQLEASRQSGLSLADVERAIFKAGLLPGRYQRNCRMISAEQQALLFESCVAVVGCGGLGGYVLEELARIGVGRLVAIDPDRFEEHNLNRQLLSGPANLGESKVTAAVRRISEVNPAVDVRAVPQAFRVEIAEELIGGTAVVVDALDSVEVRLALSAGCSRLGVPLVSGTIAGWFGYVTTVYPGDDTLRWLYSRWSGGRGVEAELGNPSFTPAAVASLQVAETIKLLLGTGNPLRRRVLCVNLLDMEVESVSMDGVP